jgi:hypothetical protein
MTMQKVRPVKRLFAGGILARERISLDMVLLVPPVNC